MRRFARDIVNMKALGEDFSLAYEFELLELIASKEFPMARKTIAERIAQLDARKKALQARQGKQERADDTRRKVLLGALVLHRLENAADQEFPKRLGDWLRRELPGFLTRDSDKALFGELLGHTEVKLSEPPPRETELADASASPHSATLTSDTPVAARMSID